MLSFAEDKQSRYLGREYLLFSEHEADVLGRVQEQLSAPTGESPLGTIERGQCACKSLLGVVYSVFGAEYRHPKVSAARRDSYTSYDVAQSVTSVPRHDR